MAQSEADERAPLLVKPSGYDQHVYGDFHRTVLEDEVTGLIHPLPQLDLAASEVFGSDVSQEDDAAATILSSQARFPTVVKGYLLIALAQICFPITQLCAKLLQTRPPYLSSTMTMFIRYSVTAGMCLLYVPFVRQGSLKTFLVAPRGVRRLLAIRSVISYGAGFSLTYSVRILPLAENTVIQFITPLITTILGAVILHEYTSPWQLAASALSFIGVIILTKPTSFIGETGRDRAVALQRLGAVSVAFAATIFMSTAFLIIRKIGLRMHPLTGVLYLSGFAVVVSGSTILWDAKERVSIAWPESWQEGTPLIGLGLAGFVAQAALTAGLQRAMVKSSNLMYLQVPIALMFDRFIIKDEEQGWMDIWSVIGILLILGGTILIATGANKTETRRTPR